MSALRARLQALWGGVRAWYARHSRRDQRIILGVVVFAALCLAYLWGWVPLREYRQTVGEEINEGQQQLARSARFLGSGDSLRAERGSLQKKLTQSRGRLLPGRGGTLGAAALQERANALATEKGITVQSTQVMKEEVIEPYRKVSVRLTLSGELKPLADLVSGLEYGQQLAIPFFEVNRRGAVAGARGPRVLSATMEVTGFVLGEEAKAEAGEGVGEGAGEGPPGAKAPREGAAEEAGEGAGEEAPVPKAGAAANPAATTTTAPGVGAPAGSTATTTPAARARATTTLRPAIPTTTHLRVTGTTSVRAPSPPPPRLPPPTLRPGTPAEPSQPAAQGEERD